MIFIEIGNNKKRPKLVVEGLMNLVFDGGNFEYLIGKGYNLREKRKNLGLNFIYLFFFVIFFLILRMVGSKR